MSEEALTPIGELFAKDPLKMVKDDIDELIKSLRAQRHRFVVVGDKAVGKPEAKKSKAQLEREARQEAVKGLDLGDLLDGI